MTKIKSCGLLIYNLERDELLELSHHAERLGYDALWFGEHYLIPGVSQSVHPAGIVATVNKRLEQKPEHENRLPETPIYDPWTQAGLIAATTKRLKIGTAICIVPINNPLLLARQTITVHDMSNGRLLLGAGAGWLKEEFDAVGVPFEERGARLDESLDILKKAWAGGYFEHQGRFNSFGPIRLTGNAVNIPVVAGGNNPRAIRRAARTSDAWLNSGIAAPDQVTEIRAAIEAERKAIGTDDKPFAYYVRPPGPEREQFDPFLAAGFEHFVLSGWTTSPLSPLREKIARLEATALALGLA